MCYVLLLLIHLWVSTPPGEFGKFGTTKKHELQYFSTEKHYKSFYMSNDLTKEIHCKEALLVVKN